MPQVSPPKPWERAGAVTSTPVATANMTSTDVANNTSSSAAPAIPARPAALTSTAANRSTLTGTAATTGYSPYSTSRYGTGYGGLGTGLGGYGSYGSYGSSYSRFGGLGGYGGYGMGGYGGYGMGGYGMGGYGMGGYGGMNGDPNDPNSLMRGMESSTAATFQMIESIVGAFGSFAQMLESTFMATHSSFFAMVAVAEQFGNLRNTLGQILGIFTLIKWVRMGIAKITGRPPPVSAGDLTPDAFANFGSGSRPGSPGSPARGPKGPSKKPFIVFILAVFGLPYLMGKLIRALASKQEEEEKRRQEALNAAAGGQTLDLADPMKKLEFCKVLFDFAPENPAVELEVKKGDLVAVLSKTDPLGNASQWWKCRTRDSRVGYLPEPYLEAIVRNGQTVGSLKQIEDGEASRTGSLTAASTKPGPSSRTHSMMSTKLGNPADITLASFQKSGFF